MGLTSATQLPRVVHQLTQRPFNDTSRETASQQGNTVSNSFLTLEISVIFKMVKLLMKVHTSNDTLLILQATPQGLALLMMLVMTAIFFKMIHLLIQSTI